ncbi:18231_t:CDS:10 [Entrophospora sp. SA101]|nr:18231_t:CDS:10 [Entrophospora sp. SA101]
MSSYLNWSWLPSVNNSFMSNYYSNNNVNNKIKSNSENSTFFGFFGDRTPKVEKYSLENLRQLSTYLKNYSVNEDEGGTVETMKEMTQILIWDFLLSNNYVNSIVWHKFDFSNEEILAYYIYLLRTLSFKLDTNTLYFFFNEQSSDFPLYSEAIKFFNSDESMIRVAVRTITLNIFAVNDSQMHDLILDPKASPYFSNLVNFISDHAFILNKISYSPNYEKQYQKFNYYLAEHCDNFYYINDIIHLENFKMNEILTVHLMDLLLQPIYADSLIKKELLPYNQTSRVNPVVALALLCHVLHIFRYPKLVTALIAMLFSNSPKMMDYPLSPARMTPNNLLPSAAFKSRNLYREAIMGFLIPEDSEDCDYFDINTLPALCLLYMSCRNHAIAPDVLIATDVYPQKLLKTRRLLNTLTSNLDDYNLQATASSSSNNIPFSLRDRRKSMDSLSLTSSVTSLHLKHITSDTEDEFQHIPNSYKSLHSLFVDDDNVTQYGSTSSVPSIKISGQNNNHSDICKQHRNYRSELVHTILTLLCKYYHLCRSITLQVLLELLYYNGSGECLTPDQIELMNKTERDLQEKLKKYFSESSEFPLEQIEKALEESMFGGDKKPVVKEDNSEDIVKCVKTLNLIRQSRLLLSRQTISEEFNFENDELNEDQELVYHNIADEEKIALAKEMSLAQNQEQHHKPPKNLNDLITEYDKSRKNIAADLNNNNDDDSTISSNVEELEISVDKRKLTVLEKLGIELNE